MISDHLLVQKEILFALFLFFAERAWKYYDKIKENNINTLDMINMPACNRNINALLLTLAISCFLLGFFLCLYRSMA